jgi:hypothetical protein
LKKKKEELLQRLYREPRYKRVKWLVEDYELTLTTATANHVDAAEALVLFVTPAALTASAAYHRLPQQ